VKRVCWFFVYLLVVFIPCSASADWPAGENLLGLYSADDGTGYNHIDVGVGPFTIYLVATGITDPIGMVEWGARITWDTPVDLYIPFPQPGWPAYAPVPDEYCAFCCGHDIDSPLPVIDDVVLLAALNFLVGCPGVEAYFYLHACDDSPVPGLMYYRGASNPDLPLPLGWTTGGEGYPDFSLNLGPITPVVDAGSWGAVKQLYR